MPNGEEDTPRTLTAPLFTTHGSVVCMSCCEHTIPASTLKMVLDFMRRRGHPPPRLVGGVLRVSLFATFQRIGQKSYAVYVRVLTCTP